MLEQFSVANYRGFKKLCVDGLRRVNLFVGRNNSGKTSLLEAAHILLSDGDIASLFGTAMRRGETLFVREQGQVRPDLSHCFHGHLLNGVQSFSFDGASMGSVTISFGSDFSKNWVDANPNSGFPPNISEQSIFIQTPSRNIVYDAINQSRIVNQISAVEVKKSVFLSTDSLSNQELAGLWDQVTLKGLDNDVRDALRIIDPAVESVHALSGISPQVYFHPQVYASRTSSFVVGMKGVKYRVPLGSLGDGMRRILGLSVAILATDSGAIFIDEIDTGLHHSIMKQLWAIVIDRAREFGVQVFATTHSWDCIQGLAELCEDKSDMRKEVAVHKLDRNLSKTVLFNGELLPSMGRNQVDPR
jgi:hypothetical protein